MYHTHSTAHATTAASPASAEGTSSDRPATTLQPKSAVAPTPRAAHPLSHGTAAALDHPTAALHAPTAALHDSAPLAHGPAPLAQGPAPAKVAVERGGGLSSPHHGSRGRSGGVEG